MSDKKSITIASTSLIGGGGSKRKSKRNGSGSGERRIRPSSIIQPSTLKKTLLERIKQHQRSRERSREHHNAKSSDNVSNDASVSASSSASSSAAAAAAASNFTQSIDFLRKLAMKRREQQQQTQKRPQSSSNRGLTEAKTPEAQMMNKIAETLHNGEILTNTGLLGLPVVLSPQTHVTPMISLDPMPMSSMPMSSMPMQMQMPSRSSMPMSSMPMPSMSSPSSFVPEIQNSPPPPNITQLADMYNNTIASETAPPLEVTAKEPPLHIPTNPEDYLPSIFIKEEPPHGCLKNGNKPTFREWATNMLKKPVDAFKNMVGGDSSNDDGATTSGEHHNKDGLNGEFPKTLDPEQVAGMRVKIRKTHKKRFRIGKHDDVVGVLLKNKQTQRHIQSQHLTLKQKTIGEIRKYLYEHHLLKIGSNAPPDVLRRMYEDSILTGDVKNTNNDVLLHNFMSGGGSE